MTGLRNGSAPAPEVVRGPLTGPLAVPDLAFVMAVAGGLQAVWRDGSHLHAARAVSVLSVPGPAQHRGLRLLQCAGEGACAVHSPRVRVAHRPRPLPPVLSHSSAVIVPRPRAEPPVPPSLPAIALAAFAANTWGRHASLSPHSRASVVRVLIVGCALRIQKRKEYPKPWWMFE